MILSTFLMVLTGMFREYGAIKATIRDVIAHIARRTLDSREGRCLARRLQTSQR